MNTLVNFAKTAVAIAITPTLLTLSLNTFAANATTAVNVTPAERAKIEAVVHDYLVNKPEVLVEAMQALQKKQIEQAEKTVKVTQETAPKFANALFHQANDPIGGNANGNVNIAEFFDYQCPHCVDMAPAIDATIKGNPNVRMIYKEFPIRGPVSDFAARAALAANKQGKYSQMHNGLLTSNKPLSNDVILAIAKSVGLDIVRLQKDMTDKSTDDQLKANIKLAQDLKLFGTPAFFITNTSTANSKITYVPGQMNQAQMQEVIAGANK